jgi:hypothetical protein
MGLHIEVSSLPIHTIDKTLNKLLGTSIWPSLFLNWAKNTRWFILLQNIISWILHKITQTDPNEWGPSCCRDFSKSISTLLNWSHTHKLNFDLLQFTKPVC